MRKSLAAVVGAVVVFVVAAACPAGADTVYTSQSSFLGGLGAHGFDNFNDIGNGDVQSATFTRGVVNGYQVTYSSLGNLFSNAGSMSISNPADPLVLNFSGNVTAVGGTFFGADFFGNATSGTITATLQNGTHLTFSGTGGFGGFTSLTPITSLSILNPDGLVYPSVDDLYYGAALGAPIFPFNAAPVNLVVNGGFETGDFTGWNLSGNVDFNTQVNAGPPSPDGSQHIALLGAVGTDNIMQQTIATTPGDIYDVSFWMNPIFAGDLTNPNDDLKLKFDGATLFDKSNFTFLDLPGGASWVKYDYHVIATGTSTVLEFDSRADGHIWLDDVSVIDAGPSTPSAAAPLPSTFCLGGALLIGALAASPCRRKLWAGNV
jgi:hypothetical protein